MRKHQIFKNFWSYPYEDTNFGQAHEASEEPQDADAAVFAEGNVPVGHSVLLVQDGEDVQHWQYDDMKTTFVSLF